MYWEFIAIQVYYLILYIVHYAYAFIKYHVCSCYSYVWEINKDLKSWELSIARPHVGSLGILLREILWLYWFSILNAYIPIKGEISSDINHILKGCELIFELEILNCNVANLTKKVQILK